ncbi:MAG: DnaJ domain-containing protein [Planctomycetes bacterium]|nr:DnaJ domain-containing protein [Planctomycetota bacterium]
MAVKYQDYYETLGVPRSASQDEIQRAYRKLARQFHPDVNKTKEAESKFKLIGEAYEVLKDPEKRKKYDELGADWKAGQEFRPPPGWEGRRQSGPQGGFNFSSDGGDFTDFFESFFGRGGAGGQGFGRRTGNRDGQDVEADITISLEEAIHGSTRQLTLQSPDDGSTRTLSVKIPQGVVESSTIRLNGQGGPGMGEGEPGDLLLRVHLAKHPQYEVDGHDLITTLDVTPWDAALGAKVAVPTPYGEVTMTVPPGTSSGQKLRLKFKGLPHRGGSDAGDLFVRLRIVVPKELSSRERELFEQLQKESRFKANGK